jgi:hypothetical protein
MSIERGEGFRFATPEQLEDLYLRTEEQAHTLGWPFRDSPLYGYHEGLPLADIGLRYGLAVNQSEARRLSGTLHEALGSFTTISIGFYEEYYAYDERGRHDYREPSASFSIYRKRKNPLEEDLLSLTRHEQYGQVRYEDGHTYFWREETLPPAEGLERFKDTLSSWRLEGALGLDRITSDEAAALTMIVTGLSKLRRLREPWRRLSFLHPAD